MLGSLELQQAHLSGAAVAVVAATVAVVAATAAAAWRIMRLQY